MFWDFSQPTLWSLKNCLHWWEVLKKLVQILVYTALKWWTVRSSHDAMFREFGWTVDKRGWWCTIKKDVSFHIFAFLYPYRKYSCQLSKHNIEYETQRNRNEIVAFTGVSRPLSLLLLSRNAGQSVAVTRCNVVWRFVSLGELSVKMTVEMMMYNYKKGRILSYICCSVSLSKFTVAVSCQSRSVE